MKKIIILILISLILTGCGQSTQVDCEQLDLKECKKYNNTCSVCPNSVTSEENSCHVNAFCNNFNDLYNTNK